MPDWQFSPDELDRMLSSVGHNRMLGQRYHAHGPDWLELAMPWSARIVGNAATGAIAWAAVFTLVDNATGASAWLRRGGILPQVTINLRIDQIRESRRGATLIARCECYRIEGAIAYVQGAAYDERPDDPVCRVSGTYMLLEGSPLI